MDNIVVFFAIILFQRVISYHASMTSSNPSFVKLLYYIDKI